MANAINWFEIPATDFERAVAFYERVLGIQLHVSAFGGVPHAFFSAGAEDVGGAIIAGAVIAGGDATTGHAGPVIYLNAGDQIAAIMGRVTEAGGAVLAPVTAIPPQGQIALFRDSEGNRVGLHAPPQQ